MSLMKEEQEEEGKKVKVIHNKGGHYGIWK